MLPHVGVWVERCGITQSLEQCLNCKHTMVDRHAQYSGVQAGRQAKSGVNGIRKPAIAVEHHRARQCGITQTMPPLQ